MSSVVAKVVVIKSSGSDGAVLPVTEEILKNTSGNISFGRRVENTIRINKPCVSRTHTAIFFEKRDDGSFGASLRTMSKTNPTILNNQDMIHHGDEDQSLKHEDVFTVGDRSFRFEFCGDENIMSNTSRNENVPNAWNAKPARFGSARKKTPKRSATKKKLKKALSTPIRDQIKEKFVKKKKNSNRKRSLATPLRKAIASHRVATPVANSFARSDEKESFSAKKMSTKKKVVRSLSTPLRKAITDRRIATPNYEASKISSAKVRESEKKVVEKHLRRALATPLREAIATHRVVTPASQPSHELPISLKKSSKMKKKKKKALPTPMRNAINARRLATPLGKNPKKTEKCSKKKAKSSTKKKTALPTPIRSEINALRMSTPVPISCMYAESSANETPQETFAQVKSGPVGTPFLLYGENEEIDHEKSNYAEKAYQQEEYLEEDCPEEEIFEEDYVEEPYQESDDFTGETNLPVKLGAEFQGKKTVFDTPSPRSREDIRYNVHWTYSDYSKVKKEKIPEPATFEGLSEMMQTPKDVKPKIPAPSSLRSVGKSCRRSIGKSLKKSRVFLPTPIRVAIGARRIATPVEKVEISSRQFDAEKNFEKEGEKADIFAEKAEDSLHQSLALPTPIRKCIHARRIATPLPVPESTDKDTTNSEASSSALMEAEEDTDKADMNITNSETSSSANVEAGEETYKTAEVCEKGQSIEETVEKEPKITALSEVVRTAPTVMKKMPINALMEALSKDDNDGTYDWFNCIVVGRYKKGKGVQIQWADSDGVTPVGKKEWTTRIRVRMDDETSSWESIKDEKYFSSLRVVDLKEELLKLNLSRKGRKADLVQRLVEHFA